MLTVAPTRTLAPGTMQTQQVQAGTSGVKQLKSKFVERQVYIIHYVDKPASICVCDA